METHSKVYSLQPFCSRVKRQCKECYCPGPIPCKALYTESRQPQLSKCEWRDKRTQAGFINSKNNSNNRLSPKVSGAKGLSRTAGQTSMGTETGMALKVFFPVLLCFVLAGKFKHLYMFIALQHYHNPQAYAAHRENPPIPTSSRIC